MKKLGLLAVAAAVALTAGSLQAKESAAGGLEISGNIDVVTGWQHDSADIAAPYGMSQGPTFAVPPGVGTPINANDMGTIGGGQLGEFRGLDTARRDTFNFYLDQVEVDINKTFGENIRARADIDFGRALSGSYRGAVDLEQAYITAGFLGDIGNGFEFLVGRFNAPIGLESVDRNENTAISFSNIYKYLRPHNVTGLKLYYAFNETFDMQIYAVNNLLDTINNDSPIPSVGARFGLTFGEKGEESTIGLSYAGGPEAAALATKASKHWTHIGDLDFNIRLGENFSIAGEGIYRQDNQGGACVNLVGGENCKVWGGMAQLGYGMNESWNAWLRYEYLQELNSANYTTNDSAKYHSGVLGVGYQIADGAKVKVEYRIDLQDYAGAGVQAGINHGAAAEFAYNF